MTPWHSYEEKPEVQGIGGPAWTGILKESAVHVLWMSASKHTSETRADAQNLVTQCTVGTHNGRFFGSITF